MNSNAFNSKNLDNVIDKYNINLFNLQAEKSITPPWITSKGLNTELSSLSKNFTSKETCKKSFHKVEEKYLSFTEIYKDTAKYDTSVSISVTTKDGYLS